MWSKRKDLFELAGYAEYKAHTSANSAVGYGDGPTIIKFFDGHEIEIRAPKCEISGLMMGERATTLIDTLYVKDRKNDLYAEIAFCPGR